MAMALDPNLSYDDKRRIGMARATTDPDTPTPQTGLANRMAKSVFNFAANPTGYDPSQQPVNDPSLTVDPTPAQPQGGNQGMTRAGPSNGRSTGIPDIYELPSQNMPTARTFKGATAVPGRPDAVRVGSPDLRARDGVVYSGDALDSSKPVRVFEGTGQGYTDAGTRAGLARGTSEWEQANRQGGQDPDQVSRNQLALSETRVQRGEGYDPTQYQGMQRAAAMGALGFGGVSGAGGAPGTGGGGAGGLLGVQKTLADIRSTQDADARANRGQNIELQQKNEDRANNLFDSSLKDIQADKRYAGLTPADQTRAAHIRTAVALENAGIDSGTTTRGRLGMSLAGEGLARTTNPAYDSSTEVPPEQAELGRFGVRRASGIERLGQDYVAEGPSFSRDPQTGRMVEVAAGAPGSTKNDSTRFGAFARGTQPDYLKAGTGEDISQLRGLIDRQRSKAQQLLNQRGAQRRGN